MRPIERRETPPRATTRRGKRSSVLETTTRARAPREGDSRAEKGAREEKRADPLDEDAVNTPEREPVFLKDKGDAFFRAGNARSALEAHTAAVDAERDALPDARLRLHANAPRVCS